MFSGNIKTIPDTDSAILVDNQRFLYKGLSCITDEKSRSIDEAWKMTADKSIGG
jgi:hypothetical protein